VSQYSEELVDSDIEPERQGSIVRLIEGNKMRRLQDAKLAWTKHHSSSSPFRMQYGSSFSNNSDSGGSFSSLKLANHRDEIKCESPSRTSTFKKDKLVQSSFKKSKVAINAG
jgi:hypothetical protein